MSKPKKKPRKKPAKKRDGKIGTYRCRSCNDYGAMKYKGECLPCFTLRTNPLAHEARASSSLDGETQACPRGNEDRASMEHTCERRPMTPAERAVVEAAEKLREWRMSPKGDPFPVSRPELDVIHAVAALRAERKEGK